MIGSYDIHFKVDSKARQNLKDNQKHLSFNFAGEITPGHKVANQPKTEEF